MNKYFWVFVAVGLVSIVWLVQHRVAIFSSDNLPNIIAEKPLLPKKIPILLYHYVEIVADANDTTRQSLNIPPRVFEQQIIDLKQAGYTFITPQQLRAALDDDSDTKYIILSFDDGYRTFYEQTYPIIKRQNIPVVVYVLAGLLNQPNYMYSWQVQDLATDKLIEIGFHGYTHQTITSLSETELNSHFILGLQILENITGNKAVSYAYPYGIYEERCFTQLNELGLTSAVTTKPGNLISYPNRYQLPRLRPGQTTGVALINLITANYEF